ncbi:hypothetical protein NVP1089O_95 [Vibrio phage 1.089.O._10N.261.51.F9]|nr:hypothetical protein NVP1012O_96 [Vibrio phage 1.012.O._10N.261.48.C12]AUR86833.1 hypothetical protein NVP1089O_95 [Vibrio phage 1.089.O._10N.261.51.F9]AUR87339.1 hypothetical protein NVP1098O_95 [Vibrio phage 1.098.O._10N.286.51.B9]AUR88854.1 hypothetical protein NVP1118A_94 [Vibrio phage 1.118.A._10N.261.49.F6]AUR88950.1 hypothetical protein NVP1118B_94 [Vibrio phage 1.118.B._10N.261.49.F6]AUR91440.1 hypothetical protein NVP1160O_91 [Vibrio phage 1.160.O._10N.261.48.B11]AUR97152.1 hypoth
MKLITLATLALTLLAPVTHSETLSVEQILAMQNARNAAHEDQERSDNALILTLCAQDKTKACLTSARRVLVKYKASVVQLHENDKIFTERITAGQ